MFDSYLATQAVPEPSTWALLIVGSGLFFYGDSQDEEWKKEKK
jgi:PEP-CTERM motif